MKSFGVLLCIVPALAAPSNTLHGGLTNELQLQEGLPANYSIGEMQWRGFEDFDEGQVFTGTIQDVIHQMKQIKGNDYTPRFVSEAKAEAANPGKNATHSYHTDMEIISCGGDGANPSRIEDGVNYLHKIALDAICNIAPKTCSRVSCSWKSGIWLCNDIDDTVGVICNTLGDYAAKVLSECTINDSVPRVSGTDRNDERGYSVKVGHANC
ncbi:hypothetical protein F4777DRAFT_212935 [Nemania sp. FL0916]|nr:hypothetical protein F4777DRAFT_212935 [Nemania sp. FL0916]